MNTKLMFSSKTDEWETPQTFYEMLNKEFGFTLDPCSTDDNCKCSRHFTKADNGLDQSWGGETVFCNPPYGRAISSWVQKAYSEWAINDAEVVMLLPARTDTKWFHDYIYNRAEIRFIKGRLKFGGCKHNAPFPNMIVIFRRLKTA